MKTIRRLAAFAVFFASALYATSASAGLIVNGGFETGDLTGWNVSQTADNYVGASDGDFVPFGTYALYIGCVNSLCSTSQSIGTIAGQSYIFSFEYGSDGRTPNEFVANFNGITVFHTLNDVTNTAPGFTHESFNVIATESITIVEFLGANPNGYLALDNVSVEAVAIPAPGSLALLLAGLVGLGLLHRRKTSQGAPARRATAPR